VRSFIQLYACASVAGDVYKVGHSSEPFKHSMDFSRHPSWTSAYPLYARPATIAEVR